MSACVSHDEDVSERSSSQAAPVPGEKTHDEGAYAPGAPGSSGSVRWWRWRWSGRRIATKFRF